MLVMLSKVLPTLVSVTAFAELVWPRTVDKKAKLDAESFTWVPVPLRLIDCGLAPPLSVMEMEADRVPVAVGWSVNVRVQLPPATTEVPHVFV
jgi:hypothetical protein